MPFPAFIEPMQPTLHKYAFSNPAWLFEPKWDGYRALCFLVNDQLRFVSRRNHDLTQRFPSLQSIAPLIKAGNAILDGEIVALDSEGMPCFDQLRTNRRKDCEIVYYAFDLVYLNDKDLRGEGLSARKQRLDEILPVAHTGRVRATEYIVTQGEGLFHELEKRELEGMVAKRMDSLYVSGRSRDWLKIKTAAGREAMRQRLETWQQ